MKIQEQDLKFLSILSKEYPNSRAAKAEIINLTSILNLPKGTEYFLSDLHGEADAFRHILRSASGTIKRRIDEVLADVNDAERQELATLIYYPEEKLELLKDKYEDNLTEFYKNTLTRLVILLQRVSFKYSRSYVRKLFPKVYAYVMEELMYGDGGPDLGRDAHKLEVISTIIDIGSADDFIVSLCDVVCRLSIYKLHILGDIFDRGEDGDKVMDIIKEYHNVDIVWGNHDILWMGAAAGNKACIANVIRICTRYDNLHTLEVGYGISLRPLLTFAYNTYSQYPCTCFKAANSIMDAMHETDMESLRRIGMAISVIQFKLEGQLVDKHPYYEMSGLKLLDKINFEKKTVTVDGVEYPMKECDFPTIDPNDPYKLTSEEEAVMDRLRSAFLESKLLQDHVQFLFEKGSLYKVENGNLLFHGCMPLTEEGEFDYINTTDGPRRGKEWFDYADRLVRTGYFASKNNKNKNRGIDLCWYLWCGYKSPLFGKRKITTFERMFIEDEKTWKEEKNPYYKHIDNLDIVLSILKEFEANIEEGCIINGHVPVKKGTSPIHAGGRSFIIDGGFAKPYQKETGIAGYSLVQNSYGFILSAQEPFTTKDKAITEEFDTHSTQVAREDINTRMLNKHTDQGRFLQQQVDSLKVLLEAYRQGILKERV